MLQTLAGTPQEQPIAVIVLGQTGAGKTAITSLATTTLTARGEPVYINLDTLQAVPPEVRRADGGGRTTAGAYTGWREPTLTGPMREAAENVLGASAI
ncbi:zeta toxin family protein [Streptomyces sp. NPDC057674]|uniref:zeta toxin family protein n=1 Tax=Streptomyces sp. NPDC057674 TaxID=3346203 RepID=UPI0036AFB03B